MATNYDFSINKGETFTLNLTLKDSNGVPIDLTDYSVSGFLKYKYSDTGRLLNLQPAKQLPYESGIINISCSATGTAVLPVTIAVYDIEISLGVTGNTTKILNGKVNINPEVTY